MRQLFKTFGLRYHILTHMQLALLLCVATSTLSVAQTYRVVRRVVPASSRTTSTSHTAYRPVYSPSGKLQTPSTRSSRTASSRSRSISPSAYRLDDGDALAIIVDGVLGEFGDAPIHMPTSENSDILPGIGYPILVRKGAVALPLIDPVNVRGLTPTQAQKKISNAYRREKILKFDNRVMVSLLRKRTVDVTVIHDDVDSLSAGFNSRFPGFNQTPRKKVSNVTLPADRAHLLDALSAAVVDLDSEQVVRVLKEHRRSLRSGEVVNVKSPSNQFFYASGALNAGQYPIPRDRQLNALQAVALAGGSFNSQRGGAYLGPSELVITRQNGQTFRVDYQRLQANPNAVRIRPGDSLSLQYKPREVIGNAAANAIGGGVIRRGR